MEITDHGVNEIDHGRPAQLLRRRVVHFAFARVTVQNGTGAEVQGAGPEEVGTSFCEDPSKGESLTRTPSLSRLERMSVFPTEERSV